MQLGELIRSFADQTTAGDMLMSCDDLLLVARVSEISERLDEKVGEYAASAVRRFANRASNEDWLGLMGALERGVDPGLRCLVFMLDWSLKQDEKPQDIFAENCACGESSA